MVDIDVTHLVDTLNTVAERRPHAVAVSTSDDSWTFGELLATAERLAALLREGGVRPGDRVGIVLPNSPEFVFAYYGTLLIGAVAVPLNPLHNGYTQQERLSDCAPSAVIVPAGTDGPGRAVIESVGVPVIEVASALLRAGRPLPRPDPVRLADHDGATLSYPSIDAGEGAVVLSHLNLASAAESMSRDVLRLTADDIVLACVPLLSASGQTAGINATIASGARVIVPERIDLAGILRVLAEQRVSVLTAVPLLLPALVREAARHPCNAPTLRTILVSGGSPVSTRLRNAVVSTFGCEQLQCYGPTEFSSLACATPPGDSHPERSVGRPLPGVDVRIDGVNGAGDTGELLLRGPHTMAGYWNDPVATARQVRDGWLHTGTGAHMDDGGNVYLAEGGWAARFARPKARRPSLLRRRRGSL